MNKHKGKSQYLYDVPDCGIHCPSVGEEGAEVQRRVCLGGAVVYCHHGEAPHLVCSVEEGLVMTSHFLLLDGQKEVEVEEDLWTKDKDII